MKTWRYITIYWGLLRILWHYALPRVRVEWNIKSLPYLVGYFRRNWVDCEECGRRWNLLLPGSYWGRTRAVCANCNQKEKYQQENEWGDSTKTTKSKAAREEKETIRGVVAELQEAGADCRDIAEVEIRQIIPGGYDERATLRPFSDSQERLYLARLVGCLELSEDGLPSCDPPCLPCRVIEESRKEGET